MTDWETIDLDRGNVGYHGSILSTRIDNHDDVKPLSSLLVDFLFDGNGFRSNAQVQVSPQPARSSWQPFRRGRPPYIVQPHGGTPACQRKACEEMRWALWRMFRWRNGVSARQWVPFFRRLSFAVDSNVFLMTTALYRLLYLFTDLHKERLQNFIFGGEGNMPKPQALDHRKLEEDLDLQLHLLKAQDQSINAQPVAF
jgi:hypothetical protein